MPTVRLLSSKICCRSAGPVAAAGVDAVEPLGVLAGVVVELQLVVVADVELVADLAGRDAGLDVLLGLEVLVRQLEAVVPERVLARAQLLRLLPVADPVLGAGAADRAS